MFCFILFYNLTRFRIIILHSYSSQVPETLLFNEGFSKINNNVQNPYLVYTYMNMGLASCEHDRMRLGSKIRRFIQEFNPDILVAVGEEAQEYAARYRDKNLKMQVVFSGIRRSQPYGYEHLPRITGVLEQLPVQAIKAVLSNILQIIAPHQESFSLVFLGDKSFRVSMEKNYILEQSWTPFKVTLFSQLETFDDWRQEITQLKKGPGVLFLLEYNHLRAKRGHPTMVSSKEVLEWTLANSPYPVVGLYEHHFYEGVPLSISSSAKESGEKAASLVQSLIDGKNPGELSALKTDQFMVGINKIKGHDLKIPKSFEVIAHTNDRYKEK